MIKDFSIEQLLSKANWQPLEKHLDELKLRVDDSIIKVQEKRIKYREELLENKPELKEQIKKPSNEKLNEAIQLLKSGTVAASDGTVAPVPLLGGSKIQVGVVIVFNTGEVVNLVTRVFEAELIGDDESAVEFFSNLRSTRKFSNLLSRAIMLYGERNELLNQDVSWRMLHGQLIPHELRTGAGKPEKNLQPTFDLINKYINTENFIAVSEGSDDIDILNAAILLNPGEYIVIRSLKDDLNNFLEGDEETGQMRANFKNSDRNKFRQFVENAGPQVAIVLVKAGPKPFLIECHVDKIEEAVSLFLADSLWTRGFSMNGEDLSLRCFPFHIDLADQVARTLLKGGDFTGFVESRLFDLGIESGIFDLDPRRMRS